MPLERINMNLKNKIKIVLENPSIVLDKVINLPIFKNMSDQAYLKMRYKIDTGETLNLENPTKFNEKLQWLKLHDHNPQYTKMVDKFEVKEYMKELIGEDFIIPTLGVWDSFDEIDFNMLPNQFVLKSTHDSGGVVICKDKANLDIENARKVINKSLKRNYFYSGREWPYKNVKPRIIAEKYMVDESGYELKDYKIFLFSGKAKYIQVDFDRFTDHHRNFYSTDWEYVPFTTLYPTNPDRKIERPQCLSQLLHISEKIAKSLDDPKFLRVDLYVINNSVYFGEVTFYHGSGYEKFYPEAWNEKLGSLI